MTEEEELIECERVGLDYFDSAPVRHVASETIKATPEEIFAVLLDGCLLYTSPSPRDQRGSRMPSSA